MLRKFINMIIHRLESGHIFALIAACVLIAPINQAAASVSPACEIGGISLRGKVEIVESFPDLKVQIVSSFPDLKVETVQGFADDCGKWQFVDSFPDFTIQYVESFPDLKIQFVTSFPGLP